MAKRLKTGINSTEEAGGAFCDTSTGHPIVPLRCTDRGKDLVVLFPVGGNPGEHFLLRGAVQIVRYLTIVHPD
jgi:hypothetical protein